MAFSSALLADMVIQGLYDHQGLYNLCNRSFDGLVTGRSATSVSVPKNPTLTATTDGSAKDAAERKKALADTTMVDVPFSTYTVPMGEEIEAQFATNGMLLQNFIKDAVEVLGEAFDAAIITEAQTTANTISWNSGTLTWDGAITPLMARCTQLKMPKGNRIIIVPGAIEDQWLNLDEVRKAMVFNPNYMETGIAKVNGYTFYVSNNVATVGGKQNLVALYGRGLAFVLKRYMERKEVYDLADRTTYIDFNSYAAKKLLRNEYAVVSKSK